MRSRLFYTNFFVCTRPRDSSTFAGPAMPLSILRQSLHSTFILYGSPVMRHAWRLLQSRFETLGCCRQRRLRGCFLPSCCSGKWIQSPVAFGDFPPLKKGGLRESGFADTPQELLRNSPQGELINFCTLYLSLLYCFFFFVSHLSCSFCNPSAYRIVFYPFLFCVFGCFCYITKVASFFSTRKRNILFFLLKVEDSSCLHSEAEGGMVLFSNLPNRKSFNKPISKNGHL